MNRRAVLRSAAALALCPLCAKVAAANEPGHWGYSGPRGPANWGGTCAAGSRQSPVNLTGAAKAAMAPLQPAWSPTAGAIKNNGHTIEVEASGTLAVGPARFRLVQFHFHHPSEHMMDGRKFPMEAHFVHVAASGGRGVVGVMLQPGAANAAFAAIVSAMPARAGATAPAAPAVRPAALLPASLAYYSYAGSLTTPTPDCEENVSWMVLMSPAQVAAADIAKFGARFANNARPVMPMRGRTVQRSG
jgi:carbonic anhydrase